MKQLLSVRLVNGKEFTVHTKDFAKGTSTTKIYTRTGRTKLFANWYILSANSI